MATPVCSNKDNVGYIIKMFVNFVEVRQFRLERKHDAAVLDVTSLTGHIDIELRIGAIVYFTLEVEGADAPTYVIEPDDFCLTAALERLF